MIKYTPKTNKTPIISLVIVLLVSSLVFILFSYFSGTISAIILRIIGLTFLMLSAVFALRYLTCILTYSIDETDFVITKKTQATETAVCRLSFHAIKDIQEHAKALGQIKSEKLHVTNYCSNVSPQNVSCDFYDMGNENGVILFEPSEQFIYELRKRTTIDINL
jgi:hypothetical protein